MDKNFLNQLKRNIALNAERKAELKASLFLKMANEKITPSRDNPDFRAIPANTSFFSLFLRPIPVFAIIAMFVVAGGGTAFAAKNTLPGDALYVVKTEFNEKIEIVLAGNNRARAEKEIGFAERRVEEMLDLASADRLDDRAKSILETKFNKHVSDVGELIENMQNNGDTIAAAETASKFENSLEAHNIILERIAAKNDAIGIAIATLNSKIVEKAGATGKIREELDGDVSENNDSAVKIAATGRMRVAEAAFLSADNFVSGKEGGLRPEATELAFEKLREAEKLCEEAGNIFERGEYGKAFIKAGEVIKIAQEARLLVGVNKAAVAVKNLPEAVSVSSSAIPAAPNKIQNRAVLRGSDGGSGVGSIGPEGPVFENQEQNISLPSVGVTNQESFAGVTSSVSSPVQPVDAGWRAEFQGNDLNAKIESLLNLGL